MPLYALAFLCGILLLQQFSFLPDKYWVGVLLSFAIVIYFFLKKRSSIIIASILGFTWALWFAHMQSSWILPKILEGKTTQVTGIISSIPDISNHRTHFLIKLESFNQQKAHGYARLSWNDENLHLRVGEKWLFPVKLKRVHGTMNPGGFDMEAWSLQQGIRANGYVVTSDILKPKNLHQWNKLYVIDNIRQYFRDKIADNLPLSSTSPWITALAIGERKNIEAASWQVLRNTGTNHLMAIAGLHIGFMSAFVYMAVFFLWRRTRFLVLRFPAQHAASLAALIMALIYSAMAGFSIPTQRACFMFSTFLLIVLLRRKVKAWHAWSLALIAVLLWNPLSVLTESFWLSFGSVALIIYGMKGRLAPSGLWWKYGRIQWVIAIGLIPLSLWLFKQCSIVSFIANSIAIPWVGFLIVPLTFLGCFVLLFSPWLGGLCLQGADKLLQILWVILTYFSNLSWSSWYQSIPNTWVLMVACIGIIILLVPIGFPGRWFGIFWLMPLFFYQYEKPKMGDAWFTLLDVGQGLSAIVQTKNHVLVFDAGPKFGENFDMGESVVLPFLRTQGIRKVDMLVVSHADNDHRGGANAILQQMPVSEIKTSVPQFFLGFKTSYCLRGESWTWDNVTFSFIYPSREYLGLGNDSSCVLKITSHNHSVLLTGDIEKIAENYLVSIDPKELLSDIIVAPHHGSKTSGLDQFIESVHPKIVLFPVGYLNRYHFPHPAVLQKYRNINAIPINAADVGAIHLVFSGLSKPILYRDQHRHYWNEK